jgi:hypothetical protein
MKFNLVSGFASKALLQASIRGNERAGRRAHLLMESAAGVIKEITHPVSK